MTDHLATYFTAIPMKFCFIGCPETFFLRSPNRIQSVVEVLEDNAAALESFHTNISRMFSTI